MFISLSPDQALDIAARRGLLRARIGRPIQTNAIKNGRNGTLLPPFAEQSMREREAAGAAGVPECEARKPGRWPK
jgi:hypothetical protein